MEELRSVSICKSKRGKDIRANDASSLTDNKWKTLTNLVTTWSRVVLPINHQYYKYTQEQVGDRKKTAFCWQYCSGNCRPDFGRHSLINKLKMNNEVDKPGAEAAAASTWFLSDASLLCSRSSTTRTRSSTETQNSLNKFVLFTMKYVYAILMFITKVNG